ncbi:MAG: HAMP domain-containing protein [Candidatus Improbicoccus pseudotrichonymphae]|uniref:histidine kinase n=1 Tax=Candidatus Improbicoccus pseudotrichonymphae TaxID=3033792 RepID=A0AA48I4J1_9FIRM|nr:MAG: HAMP domain-containing protein [Candidatus Improbicoccus pseudotrichonymphae]
MKKLIKSWLICTVKLSSVLFLSMIILIFPLNIFNILNLESSAILIVLSMIIFSVFIFFGKIFVEKIVKNLDKISEIIGIISKDILSKNENEDDFNSENEIDYLLDKIGEIAFKIKSSECSKNDFISSMSHELRTPLTAIKGWAETMKTGNTIDFSTLKRGLEVIIKETERLATIVEELINFSGLKSGRIKMNMEKIDLMAEINEAVFIFKERAAIENKTLIYDDKTYSVTEVYGDKNRLKQVFINIIDNAVKYTQKNGIINVKAEDKEDENKIVVKILDNGCGISEKDIPNVKQKFYKANFSHKGSGIGLAIADEIIMCHGGVLEIFSKENKGTEVVVSIPKFVNQPV